MKIGTRSWNFRSDLSSGRIDIEAFLNIAAAIGLDGVEILARHFSSFDLAKAERYQEIASKLGLEIVAYALENDFAYPLAKVRQAEVDTARYWIKTAGLCGVPFVKIFTGDKQPNVDVATQRIWVKEALVECAEEAAAYNTTVLVENHSTICFTYQELASLIKEVAHPRCLICPDVYNFSKLKAEEIVYEAAEALIPQAPYSHLQFYEIDETGRELHMNMERLIGIYKKCNYSGYLMTEWEGSADPYWFVSLTKEYLQTIL